MTTIPELLREHVSLAVFGPPQDRIIALYSALAWRGREGHACDG